MALPPPGPPAASPSLAAPAPAGLAAPAALAPASPTLAPVVALAMPVMSAPVAAPLAADLQLALAKPNLFVGQGTERKPDDPPFVVVFGETNTGKSTACLEVVAGGGLILTQPGGATTARTVLGVDVSAQIQHVHRFEDLPQWIYWAGKNGFTSVYVDDGTLLMGNTMADAGARWAIWEEVTNAQGQKERRVKGYDFGMYSYIKPVVTEVGKALRWAGIPGVLSAHVQQPYVHKKDGAFPLGPDMGWGKLVRLLPCESDICLYATGKPVPKGPAMPGVASALASPWDFRCDAERGNPAVATGDRYDIAPERGGPFNIAEIIREAGKVHGYRFDVPRPRGLEWMEAVAEDIAQQIVTLGTPEMKATGPWAEYLLRDGKHFTHVRWATKDGVQRARLRLARQTNALAGLL